MKLLILMYLSSIICEFILQPQKLGDLSQKDWWWKWGFGKGWRMFDWVCASIIQAILWSIMISLPLMALVNEDIDYELSWMILVNSIIYATLKIKVPLNLWLEQVIVRPVQIGLTYMVCYYVC